MSIDQFIFKHSLRDYFKTVREIAEILGKTESTVWVKRKKLIAEALASGDITPEEVGKARHKSGKGHIDGTGFTDAQASAISELVVSGATMADLADRYKDRTEADITRLLQVIGQPILPKIRKGGNTYMVRPTGRLVKC